MTELDEVSLIVCVIIWSIAIFVMFMTTNSRNDQIYPDKKQKSIAEEGESCH